jgi:hypothetical protein
MRTLPKNICAMKTKIKIPPIRQAIFDRLINQPGWMYVLTQNSHDLTLADLASGVGMLGAQVMSNHVHQNKDFNHREQLERIAAHALGWLSRLEVKDPFSLVHAERERQAKLFRTGKILFDCSSPTPCPLRKLRVLFEECGEVAQAIDEIEQGSSAPSVCRTHLPRLRRHLITELVQVAAVAVAWLESGEPPSANNKPKGTK